MLVGQRISCHRFLARLPYVEIVPSTIYNFSVEVRIRKAYGRIILIKMPSRKHPECSGLVKDAFPDHTSCGNGKRKGSTKDGTFLNKFSSAIKFDDKEIYNLCFNMKNNFERGKYHKVNQISPIELLPSLNEAIPLPLPTTREERALIRGAQSSVNVLKRTIHDLHDQNEFLLSIAAGKKKEIMVIHEEPTIVINTSSPLLQLSSPIKNQQKQENISHLMIE